MWSFGLFVQKSHAQHVVCSQITRVACRISADPMRLLRGKQVRQSNTWNRHVRILPCIHVFNLSFSLRITMMESTELWATIVIVASGLTGLIFALIQRGIVSKVVYVAAEPVSRLG